MERLAAKGFELDAEDDDTLLESFEQLLTERESRPSQEEFDRLKRLEPFATEYTQNAAEFQQWKAAQAEKQQAAKDGDSPAALTPPKIDQGAAQVVHTGLGTGKVSRNAQGLYETTDPAYMPFVQQVNTVQLQRREFFQRFEDDPESFIGTFTKKQLAAAEKKHADEVAEIKKEMADLRKSHSQNSVKQFFAENYKEFWQTDEAGKIVNDEQGQGQLTLRGKIYAKAMKDYEDVIPDENKRHEKAVLMARDFPIEAADQTGGKKQKFLRRNANKPARPTDLPVEHNLQGKEVTAGLRNRRMSWDQLMGITKAELS